MRALILLAGPALLLAACGDDGEADNTINLDQNLSAESFSSNDVTAIDAVTGDASNMAADVNYITELNGLAEADNGSASDSPPSKGTPRRRSAGASRGNAPDSTAEPATRNSTADATGNNAL